MPRLPRRFRRPLLGPPVWLLLIAALAWGRFALRDDRGGAETLAEGIHHVAYVIDGDTFILAGDARVRLQGIDTPEVARNGLAAEPGADAATRFARQFVERAAGKVRLSFGAERTDHYGRFLAFVWDGETMLNEELVRAGLARARPDYRFSGTMKRRLLAAQAKARSAGRGLWSTASAESSD